MVNYWVVRAGRRPDNIEDAVQERGLPEEFNGKPVVKAAVFDKQPSPEHTDWMEGLGVAVVWQRNDWRFTATSESNQLLGSVGLPPFPTEEDA